MTDERIPFAKLVEFPDIADLPRMLRSFAEAIERGDYDNPHCIVWVMDCGGGRVELGLMGRSPSPGAEGHLLLAIGQRRLERVMP